MVYGVEDTTSIQELISDKYVVIDYLGEGFPGGGVEDTTHIQVQDRLAAEKNKFTYPTLIVPSLSESTRMQVEHIPFYARKWRAQIETTYLSQQICVMKLFFVCA